MSYVNITDGERKVFDSIEKNDTIMLHAILAESPNVNIVDENLMTPLQHAAYKGSKELVQMLLDYGADPNLCKHQHNYTALHFGGLSGNVDVCLALLLAGATSGITNAVNRTAAQMAAFVGHHNCVAVINNYVPKSEVEHFTVPNGLQTEPVLPPFLAESFHKLIMQVNIHPVKVALNLSNFVGLSEHLPKIQSTLELMSEREMKRGAENNEVMAFKFHYLSFITGELSKILNKQNSTDDEKKLDFLQVFCRKLLKPGKKEGLEVMDALLRQCVMLFPSRESTLFMQIVQTFARTEGTSALRVISSAINGQRGFIDNVPMCQTCGEEKPSKKCSKCKSVQYCDRNCQKLHWYWHKKTCGKVPETIEKPETGEIDTGELSAQIQNLIVQC